MPRTIRKRAFGPALTAVATAATAVVMAACGSSGNLPLNTDASAPSATAHATPTRAPAPQEFSSQRCGFRVTLAHDWSDVDAWIDWNGEALQGIGSAAFANFSDPSAGRALAVGAAPVPAGTQLVQWQAAMARDAGSACT